MVRGELDNSKSITLIGLNNGWFPLRSLPDGLMIQLDGRPHRRKIFAIFPVILIPGGAVFGSETGTCRCSNEDGEDWMKNLTEPNFSIRQSVDKGEIGTNSKQREEYGYSRSQKEQGDQGNERHQPGCKDTHNAEG
jgi:hypothetical protein